MNKLEKSILFEEADKILTSYIAAQTSLHNHPEDDQLRRNCEDAQIEYESMMTLLGTLGLEKEYKKNNEQRILMEWMPND